MCKTLNLINHKKHIFNLLYKLNINKNFYNLVQKKNFFFFLIKKFYFFFKIFKTAVKQNNNNNYYYNIFSYFQNIFFFKILKIYMTNYLLFLKIKLIQIFNIYINFIFKKIINNLSYTFSKNLFLTNKIKIYKLFIGDLIKLFNGADHSFFPTKFSLFLSVGLKDDSSVVKNYTNETLFFIKDIEFSFINLKDETKVPHSFNFIKQGLAMVYQKNFRYVVHKTFLFNYIKFNYKFFKNKINIFIFKKFIVNFNVISLIKKYFFIKIKNKLINLFIYNFILNKIISNYINFLIKMKLCFFNLNLKNKLNKHFFFLIKKCLFIINKHLKKKTLNFQN